MSKQNKTTLRLPIEVSESLKEISESDSVPRIIKIKHKSVSFNHKLILLGNYVQ